MFIVTYVYGGNLFFLRSTAWTSENVRATRFASEADAEAAITRALPFMKGKSRCRPFMRVTEG